MSRIEIGFSAVGKLLTVGLLAAVFVLGFGGTMLFSLRGEEVKVPEIVGKNFEESQDELASLGLRLKKRADRYSQEPENTVLEQLPKPGETVKTGQMVLVVTSKANAEGGEAPATIKKGDEQDDTEKIKEMISDKPKKRANANVNANANANSNTSGNSNSNSAANASGADEGQGGQRDSNRADPKKSPQPDGPGEGRDSRPSGPSSRPPANAKPAANSARPSSTGGRSESRPASDGTRRPPR